MGKKHLPPFVALALVLALAPASAWASSTASMTTYDSTLRSGDAVYCLSPGMGIFKATVHDGKVTARKWLVKERYAPWGEAFSYLKSMKKQGGHLYYISTTEGTVSYLMRTKLSTGKTETIAYDVTDYAIEGNKIYARICNSENSKVSYRIMSLDGKSKRKTSVKPNMVRKKNAEGYSVSYRTASKYIKTYLKTPKGSYYMGKVHR